MIGFGGFVTLFPLLMDRLDGLDSIYYNVKLIETFQQKTGVNFLFRILMIVSRNEITIFEHKAGSIQLAKLLLLIETFQLKEVYLLINTLSRVLRLKIVDNIETVSRCICGILYIGLSSQILFR